MVDSAQVDEELINELTKSATNVGLHILFTAMDEVLKQDPHCSLRKFRDQVKKLDLTGDSNA